MTQYDVVIPAYNASSYLGFTLKSVLEQTLKPHSIIIVDDGSKDNTADLIRGFEKEYSFVRGVFQPHTGYPGATRNAGLSLCNSPYIALVDSDDIWHPEKIEKQFKVFKSSEHSNLGLVYCGYDLINSGGEKLQGHNIIHPQLRGDIFLRLLGGNYISGSASAALIKKEALDEAGFMDESIVYGEDWDYWLRIAKSYDFDFVDEPLVSLRVHSKSLQASPNNKKKLRIILNQCKVLDKNYSYLPEHRKHFEEFRSAVFAVCAKSYMNPFYIVRVYLALKKNSRFVFKDMFSNFFSYLVYVFKRAFIHVAFVILKKTKTYEPVKRWKDKYL